MSDSVQLTKKEEEVLSLIKKGLTNKEIAQKLGIGEETIKHHVKIILSKHQIHDRKKLIAGNVE